MLFHSAKCFYIIFYKKIRPQYWGLLFNTLCYFYFEKYFKALSQKVLRSEICVRPPFIFMVMYSNGVRLMPFQIYVGLLGLSAISFSPLLSQKTQADCTAYSGTVNRLGVVNSLLSLNISRLIFSKFVLPVTWISPVPLKNCPSPSASGVFPSSIAFSLYRRRPRWQAPLHI